MCYWSFSSLRDTNVSFDLWYVVSGLPWWLSGKESAFNAGAAGVSGSIPGLGRSQERAWQPTPVFLPGESHGQRSLAGYSPQGQKESTESLHDWSDLGLMHSCISKVLTHCDCSHKIKIRLLLGRKVMTNLGSILKSRDITLPTKVRLVKALVFPVAMYGCESWTVKKAEHQRIDAFEVWCWRRLLRVPWTARRSNQSILKEISPGY